MIFRFCWHKWGRWSRVIRGFDESLHQVCECEKCGVIKLRKTDGMIAVQLDEHQVNSAIKGEA
jgi:hypothetical protein